MRHCGPQKERFGLHLRLNHVSSQAGQDLVTLHIYSPPLLVMGTYSLTDDRVGEFVPPVHEFTHGAGI